MSIDAAHQRPEGADDATVMAVGKLSEASEWIERARGHLYEFHQIMGRADFLFGDAAEQLRAADHEKYADLLEHEVIGRNVIDGRWTFQVIEEYNAQYYGPVKEVEMQITEALMDGKDHVFEAELKEQRRTKNKAGHESAPGATSDQ